MLKKINYYEKLKLVEKKTMKISEAIKLIESKTGKSVLLKENVTNEQRMSLPENIKKCIPTVVYPLLDKIEKGEGSFVLTIKKGKSIDFTLFYKLLKSKLMFSVASTMQGQTQIIIPEV